MNRVLIICGAGASSTFLALRLRGVARSRGLDLTVEAGTRFDLDDRLTGTDLLLVGPHLGAEFAELRARANDAGVGAALLPDTVFDAGGAEAAADLVADLLGAPQASTDRLTVEPT